MLAVVAIIAGVTWALLGSKFLVVRSITVTGAPDIPRGQVIAAAGVRAGTPLIRISTGTVTRRVERLTLVESARVTRSWPNAITIAMWSARRRSRSATARAGTWSTGSAWSCTGSSAARTACAAAQHRAGPAPRQPGRVRRRHRGTRTA